jgi:hypothetical protein
MIGVFILRVESCEGTRKHVGTTLSYMQDVVQRYAARTPSSAAADRPFGRAPWAAAEPSAAALLAGAAAMQATGGDLAESIQLSGLSSTYPRRGSSSGSEAGTRRMATFQQRLTPLLLRRQPPDEQAPASAATTPGVQAQNAETPLFMPAATPGSTAAVTSLGMLRCSTPIALGGWEQPAPSSSRATSGAATPVALGRMLRQTTVPGSTGSLDAQLKRGLAAYTASSVSQGKAAAATPPSAGRTAAWVEDECISAYRPMPHAALAGERMSRGSSGGSGGAGSRLPKPRSGGAGFTPRHAAGAATSIPLPPHPSQNAGN